MTFDVGDLRQTIEEQLCYLAEVLSQDIFHKTRGSM